MKVRPLRVAKLEGAGNDFLFVEAKDLRQSKLKRPEMARRLCHAHFGVGADGLVVVEKAGPRAWSWDFYNRDGSVAEMCGNAARCMARYLELTRDLRQAELHTRAGVVSLRVAGTQVDVHMPVPEAKPRPLQARVAGKPVRATLVNSGVPHVVVEVGSLLKPRCRELAGQFRWHRQAGRRGANVTFVKRNGSGNLQVLTFERGVEDFTLACGTGVVAAAILESRRAGQQQIRVATDGGRLQVKLSYDRVGEKLRQIVLRGPAKLVAWAEIDKEILR